MKKSLVILTGAGISAESGIKTFRDSDGLWENHRIEDVATPEGFRRNPELVLDFYNQRRRQLLEVEPNVGHFTLAALEQHFDVQIITQNVDDLHERAGSKNVLHLHGQLLEVRSVFNKNMVQKWEKDLVLGDKAPDGGQLRPNIVWFNEEVPLIETASKMASEADIFMVVGTSLQVYPAAGLMRFCASDTPIYYVDPRPTITHELKKMRNLKLISESATTGLPKVSAQLLLKYCSFFAFILGNYF
jgi:NAD-dependent deacetylase